MKQKENKLRKGETAKRGNGEKTISPSPLHRFSPSRCFLAMLLLLTIAITAGCGGGGGGDGGGGGTTPTPGSTTGVWDVSTWDNATWGP